jgi:hypothetical protein
VEKNREITIIAILTTIFKILKKIYSIIIITMFDWQSLLKYVLEGIAVAIATFLIPSNKLEYTDIILIALTAAAVFAVLDQFSPMVAVGARQGSGFAIGYQQIGMGGDPIEESNLPDNRASQCGGEADDTAPCKMIDGACTYNPNVPEEQLTKFACQDQGGKCVSVPTELEGFGGFQKLL